MKLLATVVLALTLAVGCCTPQAPAPRPTIKMAEYTEPYEDVWWEYRQWVDCEKLDTTIEAVSGVLEDYIEQEKPEPAITYLESEVETLKWIKLNVCRAV